MQRILIVEDETDIAELIAHNLRRHGFEATMVHDGLSATRVALENPPDLLILDLMLPGRNGIEVLKTLRRDPRTSDTPALLLTARAQTSDRIEGLEAGADDYLTKPFSPRELMLRVQAILKRVQVPAEGNCITLGPFRLDKDKRVFHLDHEPVELTAIEFKLMLQLCEQAGIAQDRNDLLRRIWGYSDAAHSRTLDTHMKRLRQKLGERGSWIETIRGVGYQVTKTTE